MALEFGILGPLEVRRDSKPVVIPGRMPRALLSLLLLRVNTPVTQDELIDSLWDAGPPNTARASLQNQIHALRKAIGPGLLEREPAGYVLRLDPRHLDLQRFNDLVMEARRAEGRERATKLRAALACWRGPPLAEVRAHAFAKPEIAKLNEQYLAALEDRIDVDLDLGRHVELVAELEALVTRHRVRERFWVQLMLALYRSGRQADALAAFRRAHNAFVDGLGIEPGVVLRELQRRILVQDPVLDDPAQRLGSTLERAAAILPRQPRERAESVYEYASALIRIGERRLATSTLQAAERLAAAAGERGLEARVRLTLSRHAIFTEGRSAREHLDVIEEAERVLERLGDQGGLALCCWHRAFVLLGMGRAEDAARIAQTGIERAARAEDPGSEGACRRMLAQALATGPTPVERAIAACDEQLAAGVWGSEGPVGVLGQLALLHAQAGQIAEARVLIERELASMRQAGVAWSLVGGIYRAAIAERAAGNLPEATKHMWSVHAMLEAEDDRAFLPEASGMLACLLALDGDSGEARRLARSASRTSVPHDLPSEALWRRGLALVAARHGERDEAVLLSEEALALTRGSDLLTFHGETLEEIATAKELLGDVVGAGEALDEALATYERKGSLVGAQRVRERLATK